MSQDQIHITERPELLAPAGSYEGFLGCIRAGADAVYMGGPRYGARAYAQNLTMEEFVSAIRTAHLFGRKVYMTVNVLTRQEEMEDCVRMVKSLWEAGLDGVIVQDLGVLRCLREACPGLLLHASTQMSATGPLDAAFLKKLGVCRIVPARELSLDEMKRIRDAGVEIECFIHGAMCYCYSGRCLMSSFLGGRSGNRGRCAGTCRLPYGILDSSGKRCTNGETYPISMKDMCVLDILPELIDAGIDSFKIEGRMKKPEYAAGVTAIYRKYIDRYLKGKQKGTDTPWTIDPEDRRDLLSLYIRTDLSTGYYHERNGRDLVTMGKPGYAGADERLLERIRETYLAGKPQLAIRGEAKVFAGRPAALTVRAGDTAVTVHSAQAVSAAKNRPLDEKTIREKLEKTGDTDFVFQKLTVRTDGNSFIPVGSLNALRREALGALSGELAGAQAVQAPAAAEDTAPAARSAQSADAALTLPRAKREPPEGDGQRLYIRVNTRAQLEAVGRWERKTGTTRLRLILDGPVLEEMEDGKLQADPASTLLALPPILRDEDLPWLEKFYKNFRDKCCGFTASTIGEIEFLDEKGYDGTVMGEAGLYAWNKEAADLLETYTNEEVLPLELSGKELHAVFHDRMARKVLQVYGYLPMMVTAGCVKKTAGRCTGREDGFYYLEDRMKKRFPVRTACRHCHNVIYNTVPLSLHKYMGDQTVREAGAILLAFTIESPEETEAVLDLFLSPDRGHRIRTGSEADAPRDRAFTTGHFRKGAE